uniref:Fibronectin type-III domain-containing protein n=1 Tax=Rhabditophanes sp. KR3021 TaxID=114890 RepID=A0AC35UHU3_9BILA
MESQTVNNFHKTKNQVVKFKNTVELKKTWSVFSTMDQNSYAVSEPRIVVESQTAVSLVFHPIESENVVEYQIRYYRIGISDSAITTPILTENDVLCPKFGCDWSCYLIYNLQKNPREYEFEIKARVDKIWNKYVVFKRRAWSSLERQCSITPPFFMVKNLESVDYTREIDIDVKEYKRQGTWRYILIVDMRGNEGVTAAIDMTKLHDKSKAINDETPYYIAASFTEDNFNKMNKFIIGDAKMHGGYVF